MKKYNNGGLGDKVEKIIKSVGLDKLASSDCDCDKRKEFLNKKFPDTFLAKCLTEEQMVFWSDFKDRHITTGYKGRDVNDITDIYNYITDSKNEYPCQRCPSFSAIMVKMKTVIDIVYSDQIKSKTTKNS